MTLEGAHRALQEIVDWRPELAKPSDNLLRRINECVDCQEAKRNEWPPSGLCEPHYRQMAKEVWDENEHRQNTQDIHLRNVARLALERTRWCHHCQDEVLLSAHDRCERCGRSTSLMARIEEGRSCPEGP